MQTFHVAYESSPTLPTTAEDIDTLDIITFRCRYHETTATLRDDAGDVVGHVAADGRACDVTGFALK